MLKLLITLSWTFSLNTLSLGEDDNDDDYDDDNLAFTENLVFARHYSMNLIYFE